MRLFSRQHRQATEGEGSSVSREKRGILVFHHYEDLDLWDDLAPHLRVLALRIPAFQIRCYAYGDLRTVQPQDDRRAVFLHRLEHEAMLFVPCTSAAYLAAYYQDCLCRPVLASALSNVSIQPIPFRAVHGIQQSMLPQPLAAYARGHERDAACAQIVATLEHKLQRYLQASPQHQTVAALSETASIAVAQHTTKKATLTRARAATT